LKEATLQDLTSLTVRKVNLTAPEYSNLKLVKYLHRTKNFTFHIKDYDVDIRLEDLPVISKLKGSYSDKLDVALRGEIKVMCQCPDFLFFGFKYMGTQLDYSTRKENRPPVIRNPNMKGTVCKHIGHILTHIDSLKPQMIDFMNKAKDNDYKVVKESLGLEGTIMRSILERVEFPEEIISEFVKRKRLFEIDKDIPSSIQDIRHGDLLIMKEEDPLASHKYNRLLVVRNAASKDHAICFNQDTKKFVVIMNPDLKMGLKGLKPLFDIELSDKLRSENYDTLLSIERDSKLYEPWK